MPTNITFENARIKFKNFAGEADRYNPKGGKRTFAVFIDENTAQEMQRTGWNIKRLRPRDDEDIPQAYITVEARFDKYPPKIVMISSRGQTILTKDTVHMLDWADFENVDLIVSPYTYDPDKPVKAYLKTMYATIREDELERKYGGMTE